MFTIKHSLLQPKVYRNISEGSFFAPGGKYDNPWGGVYGAWLGGVEKVVNAQMDFAARTADMLGELGTNK